MNIKKKLHSKDFNKLFYGKIKTLKGKNKGGSIQITKAKAIHMYKISINNNKSSKNHSIESVLMSMLDFNKGNNNA